MMTASQGSVRARRSCAQPSRVACCCGKGIVRLGMGRRPVA
jgi:hypothetical protein